MSTKYLSSISSASWSVESTSCLLQSCDVRRHLQRSSSKTLFGILAAAEGTTLPKKFVLKKCYDNNNEETKHAKLQKLCYKKNPNQNEGQKNLKLNILLHRLFHKSQLSSNLQQIKIYYFNKIWNKDIFIHSEHSERAALHLELRRVSSVQWKRRWNFLFGESHNKNRGSVQWIFLFFIFDKNRLCTSFTILFNHKPQPINWESNTNQCNL